MGSTWAPAALDRATKSHSACTVPIPINRRIPHIALANSIGAQTVARPNVAGDHVESFAIKPFCPGTLGKHNAKSKHPASSQHAPRPHARPVFGLALLAFGKPHQPSNLCWTGLQIRCNQCRLDLIAAASQMVAAINPALPHPPAHPARGCPNNGCNGRAPPMYGNCSTATAAPRPRTHAAPGCNGCNPYAGKNRAHPE